MSNLSNHARITEIKKSIQEASNSLLQIESHKEHIKEIIDRSSEEYSMDKGELRKLIQMYHKQNSEDIKAKSNSLLDQYELIFG